MEVMCKLGIAGVLYLVALSVTSFRQEKAMLLILALTVFIFGIKVVQCHGVHYYHLNKKQQYRLLAWSLL
jgi:hypothetical protein